MLDSSLSQDLKGTIRVDDVRQMMKLQFWKFGNRLTDLFCSSVFVYAISNKPFEEFSYGMDNKLTEQCQCRSRRLSNSFERIIPSGF